MLKGKLETLLGERCALFERCVGIIHLMWLTTNQALLLQGNLAQTNKQTEWGTKGVRNSQCPPPPRPSNASKIGVSWHPGEANTPQMQQGIWKSHDILQHQAETSSPPNQSRNRTNPSIISNHILKDTGRTERKWRFKWMSLGIFFKKLLFQTVWFSSWWIFKNSLVSFYFDK